MAKIFQKYNINIVKCVADAKVPIVKFWNSNLKLVYSININNTIGIYNTQLIKNYVKIDQRIQPLVMIIKYWHNNKI